MSNLVKALDDAIERLTVLREEMQARQEEVETALAELSKPTPPTKQPLDQAIRSFFQSLARK